MKKTIKKAVKEKSCIEIIFENDKHNTWDYTVTGDVKLSAAVLALEQIKFEILAHAQRR